MKFKKIIGFLLIISLLGSLLIGCSSQGTVQNEQQAPTSTKDSSTEQKTTSGERIEIEFWYGLGGQLGENVEDFIRQFNESQDKYTVKGVAQGNYDETYQKLQAAIPAGNAPAAVLLTYNTMNELANRGVLAPLDEYINADSSFNLEDFIPAFIDQGKVDGSLYSLPLFGTTQVLYYRHDLFEKAGVSPDELKTWESLAQAAEKLKVQNGNEVTVYGWEPMWGSGNLIDAALSKGAKYISDDGTTVLIDSPEWVETWEFFRKAIHEDKTMRIHHGGQGWEYWYKTIDDVMQGRAAGYTGSSGDQGDLDFSIITAHPQPGWESHPAKPHASAQTISIPAVTSKEQQEAAFAWMKFFTSAEMTAEWSMRTGYIAVRQSARDIAKFQEFAKQNPQILVPLKQAETATAPFIDPTGGKILDALSIAADKVEIEGIPAQQALAEAKKEAQKALDKVKK